MTHYSQDDDQDHRPELMWVEEAIDEIFSVARALIVGATVTAWNALSCKRD